MIRSQLPDLGAMLVGAANTTMDVEGVPEVQEFLRTPQRTIWCYWRWEDFESLTIIGD